MIKNLVAILLACNVQLYAQSITVQDSSLFDFWLGDWNLTWVDAEGNVNKGSNHIVRILDGKVIQENFSDEKGRFKGMSLSVFNPARKTWHQAWTDNQGGYFDFVGEVEGDKRIFKTQMKEKNGEKIIQRMVFYNINANSLTWDWELSRDGGTSWLLQWRINYLKKPL